MVAVAQLAAKARRETQLNRENLTIFEIQNKEINMACGRNFSFNVLILESQNVKHTEA